MLTQEYIITDTSVQVAMTRINRLLDDPAPAYRIFADVIAASTEQRFRSGAGPDGPWADIKAESRKRRTGDRNAPPGTDTAAMRTAATATRYGVPYALYKVAPDGLTMGTDKPGAAPFQYSSPARVFMAITGEDELAMTLGYERFLNTLIGAMG